MAGKSLVRTLISASFAVKNEEYHFSRWPMSFQGLTLMALARLFQLKPLRAQIKLGIVEICQNV
jgi:hypothetical protein